MKKLPIFDPYGRTLHGHFVSDEIERGARRPRAVPPQVSGMPRETTILLATRSTDLIKWAWHGDKRTSCPPTWADIAIGRGPCGFGCRGCFLMLTHRDLCDPLMPVVYDNDFAPEVLKWLTSDCWWFTEEFINAKGKKKEHQVAKPRPRTGTMGLGIDCADSLLWEGVTGHARQLIPLFTNAATNPWGTPLVLLTKSTNTHYLAEVSDTDMRRVNGRVPNVVVTMSLNPEPIADLWEGKYPDTLERITPPIVKRLEALRLAQDMGFEVRLRVDPILTPDGWEEMYTDFFAGVACLGLSPTMITLGTYREKNAQLDFWRARWGLPAMEFEPTVGDKREGTHLHAVGRAQIYTRVTEMIARAFKASATKPSISLCKETHVMRKELLSANCNCLPENERRRLPIIQH